MCVCACVRVDMCVFRHVCACVYVYMCKVQLNLYVCKKPEAADQHTSLYTLAVSTGRPEQLSSALDPSSTL